MSDPASRWRARAPGCGPVHNAGRPARQELPPVHEKFVLDGVGDVLGRAARNDEGAAHDNISDAAVEPLALDVRAQRANLELRRLVEAEGDDALQLCHLPRSKHLADDAHLAPHLADGVVSRLVETQLRRHATQRGGNVRADRAWRCKACELPIH
eukprot:4266824-Pleurochrysis_carterae.AAC.3